MIRFFSLLLTLFPLLSWAGEPPPATAKEPIDRLSQSIDRRAPRVVMGALPTETEAGIPELTQRIRNRLAQTGYILNHQPPDNYLIGSLEKRNLMGRYDSVLLHTEPAPVESRWIIHRPGPALIDPKTKEHMGVLSFYIGRVSGQQATPSGTVGQITDSARSIFAGDQLLRMESDPPPLQIHHTTPTPMSGRILHIENDLEMAGSDQLFAVGLGRRDRATVGLMLPIYSAPEQIIDPVTQMPVPLPGKLIGHGVLIRIGQKASLGFLTDSIRPIRLGDRMSTAP
ncbi:MAG: hypothetical protein HQL67_10100 [Magnetococcales bacterium]|nr:hypothetical protein [Magnetococcales bacterium]